jgi:hypothetical protein
MKILQPLQRVASQQAGICSTSSNLQGTTQHGLGAKPRRSTAFSSFYLTHARVDQKHLRGLISTRMTRRQYHLPTVMDAQARSLARQAHRAQHGERY